MTIPIKKVIKLTLIGVSGFIVLLFVYGFLRNSVLENTSFSEDDMVSVGTMSSEMPASTGLREGFSLPSFQSQKSITTTRSVSNNSATTLQEEGTLTQRKIIKNGQLSLVVKNIESSSEQITAIAKKVDGYVQSSSVNKGIAKELKNANMIVRVPAEDFENVFKEVKSLAEDVEKEETSVTDVGERYTDLQAQLKNLEAEEVQYQKIMSQAVTINDILQVSQKLSAVRGQIETIKGQIQYLDRQIDMSTLTISLHSESEVKILGVKWKPILNIKRSARSMLSGATAFIDFVVKVIIYVPLIALIGGFILIVVLLGRKIYYWGKNKFFVKNQ